MIEGQLRLRNLQGVPRLFVSAFLVALTVGYLHGIYLVDFTTHTSAKGTYYNFRGNESVPVEEATEIKFPKSFAEMLDIIHTHIISFALIFFSVGGVFLFSSAAERLKALLLVEPFAGTLVVFAGMWGVRYAPPELAHAFGWLMLIAGIITFLCFGAMVGLCLWEMWAGCTPDSVA